MKLIDKDAVLAIIEQLKDEAIDMEDKARWFLSAALTRRIEALEVKEVDLKDEAGIRNELAKYLGSYSSRDFAVAKHFFELGMRVNNKAQKGEEV